VQTIDCPLVLDREQLRIVTLEDRQLMREILEALIDDTSRQIGLIELAIRDRDSRRCLRLANYSRRACSNCGADAAAAALAEIARRAASGEFAQCRESLPDLLQEIERLRAIAQTV
jgi:HPt (histidine-containing phosphotransfer) domain-containing protein